MLSLQIRGVFLAVRGSKSFVNNLRLLSTKAVEEIREDRIKSWQIHSYGGLEELQLTVSRIPIIESPTDVQIKVHAASVNPIDKIMIGGYGRTFFSVFRQCELELPLTLGRDFSGTVVSKGQDVSSNIKIGDEVYGIISPHHQGSHSELILVDETLIRPKPKHLSHVEAASLLYTCMTAWSALFITGELYVRSPKNHKVLILGASGGVGTVAVQILKSQGITVIGTCSSDAVQLVESLGADNVFDYRNEAYNKNVTDHGKYDIILDCAQIGVQNIPPTWQYNKYITLNSPLMKNTDKYGLMQGLAVSAVDLLRPNIQGVCDGKSWRWGFFIPSEAGLKSVDDLIHRKMIVPTIHKVFKFEETPEAFKELAKGHARGKVVIDFT